MCNCSNLCLLVMYWVLMFLRSPIQKESGGGALLLDTPLQFRVGSPMCKVNSLIPVLWNKCFYKVWNMKKKLVIYLFIYIFIDCKMEILLI